MPDGENDSIALPQQASADSSAPQRESLLPALVRPAAKPARVLTLWAVYGLEILIVAVLRIPHDLSFFMFAFGDRGSWLVVQYLTAHGYRPTIDFGFPYGLLPITIGHLWFGLFGLTPPAFKLAMAAGGVAMAFGMARFASAMRLGRIGQALMIIALPIAIQSSLPSLSHLLEAVLLCLAIGEHSQGNRGLALAFTTAACFAKPALGYLYGFLLLAVIIKACWHSGNASGKSGALGKSKMDWPGLGRSLIPAMITGAMLLILLASVYDIRTLIASLLPLNGMQIYKTNHFGFFTPWSRTFWDPTGVAVRDYLGTIAPFWMGSTIWLVLAAIGSGPRLLRPQASNHRLRDEIIFCCGILQALFVLRFFGPPASWTYYPYLLVMGVVATSVVTSGSALIALAIALVAVVPQVVFVGAAAIQWKTMAPSAATAGLWVEPNERDEWTTVERLIAGHHAVAVGVAGGLPLLTPSFEPPIGAYLVPAEATPGEVARTIERVKTAEMVVRPATVSIGDAISSWSELRRVLDGFDVVWKGRVYQVCRRRTGP